MPSLTKKSFSPSYLPVKATQVRATGDQDFYNSPVWRNTSRLYRLQNPLCENCYNKGRLTAAALVDHIVPMPTGRQHDNKNLMSLCHRCHNQKSGKEGHNKGPLIAHLDGLPLDRNEIFKILT